MTQNEKTIDDCNVTIDSFKKIMESFQQDRQTLKAYQKGIKRLETLKQLAILKERNIKG